MNTGTKILDKIVTIQTIELVGHIGAHGRRSNKQGADMSLS